VPAPPPVPLPPARRAEQAAAQQLALAADIQTELGKRGFYVAPSAGVAGTSLESAIRDFQQAAGVKIDGQPSDALLVRLKASDLTVKDQIARLLMPGQAAVAQPNAAQPNVVKVQRALNKVGYGPLQEDGIMGAGTRTAIERFQKDHDLAVSGEPQGRMLRALASLSGITVE
jgi:peptidoglycan hydrolase-like protein with peptidoglycan-binding domain